jgi:hypothetical protein
VGPYSDWRQIALYVNGEKIREFPLEGGYLYTIQKDFLKFREMEMVPETMEKAMPKFDLNAFVTSPKEIQKQWKEGMREEIKRFWRSWCITDNFKDTVISHPNTYGLKIELKNSQDVKAHYLTLFYYAEKKVWQIYSGVMRSFGNLLAPNPKMILVFDQDRYYQCQLDLKANGVNYWVFDSVTMETQSPDFSKWLQYCIEHKIINSSDPKEPLPESEQVSSAPQGSREQLFMFSQDRRSGVTKMANNMAAETDFAEYDVDSEKIREMVGETKPRVSMILLNGLPYSGSVEDIDANTIVSIKVLSAEKGLELFGEQGRN